MRPLAFAMLLALALLAGPAAAAPPVWSVDKANSKLGFTAAMNGQAINGVFARWDAQIAFDPHDLADSHVTAAIDLNSARTGDQTRDEALPTSDWFSVRAFPEARFVSRKITAAGPGRYVAEGDLTLRGVTRPVQLPFTVAIAGATAKMNGSAPLNRSAFGVGQGQWKSDEPVALKVLVTVAITARRAR